MYRGKNFFKILTEGPGRGGPGLYGALAGFIFALLWVIFGFFKSIFIILMTIAGYYLGLRYFSSKEDFVNLLDKLFPPGMFR